MAGPSSKVEMSLPSGSRASSSTSQLAKSASSSRRPSLHSDPPSHDDDDGDDELAIQTALRPKDKSHPPTAPAPATDEGIFHIVSRQPASLGIDPQYVVQLVKDGKKVRVGPFSLLVGFDLGLGARSDGRRWGHLPSPRRETGGRVYPFLEKATNAFNPFPTLRSSSTSFAALSPPFSPSSRRVRR